VSGAGRVDGAEPRYLGDSLTTLDHAKNSTTQHAARGHGGVAPTVSRPTLLSGAANKAAGPAGGDGGVTSVQDGGGPELTNAHVTLIFWGTAGGNPATAPSAGQFESALRSIVDAPGRPS
jgi:hypothetical protein